LKATELENHNSGKKTSHHNCRGGATVGGSFSKRITQKGGYVKEKGEQT